MLYSNQVYNVSWIKYFIQRITVLSTKNNFELTEKSINLVYIKKFFIIINDILRTFNLCLNRKYFCSKFSKLVYGKQNWKIEISRKILGQDTLKVFCLRLHPG